MELIDKDSAARFISAMSPEWTWFLQHIESADGYIRFPTLFSKLITNLHIDNYPELYENEAHIGMMMLRAFLLPEEIKLLEAELVTLSSAGRARYVKEIMDELEEVGNAIVIPKTPAEQKRAEKAFNAMSELEKQETTESLKRFMMAFLASFYQSLSIMVHGEKLTSLVAQAKAGNDKAFARAVQIDKRILFAVPYFKKRYLDANTLGDHTFTEDVGAHLQRPPYKGRIRHKALYLAFAILDMSGLLKTMQHKDMFDLCIEAGLDAHTNRIDDLKNFSKRLAKYWEFQQLGIDLSTP